MPYIDKHTQNAYDSLVMHAKEIGISEDELKHTTFYETCMIAFASWMQSQYGCTPEEVQKLVEVAKTALYWYEPGDAYSIHCISELKEALNPFENK